MMRSSKAILAVSGAIALSACAPNNTFTSWNQEAGVFLDSGSFGNATANNTAYQTGELNYVVNLNNRFAQEVQTTVNFDFNSAKLDKNARAILRVQANWIRQFPEIRFKVYGHTDAVGSNAYNKRLGKRRANAAVNFLVALGIERSRLQAVVSFGEEQPLIVSQGKERLNRRTVTEVSGFFETDPRELDGKYAEVIIREYIESGTEAPPSAEGGLQAIAAAGG